MTKSIPVPPLSFLKRCGIGDWSVGQRYVDYLSRLAGLKPDSDVLEIGAGCGRNAAFMVQHAEQSASYTGFDIAQELLDWATENISPLHPHFKFIHQPIYHPLYNAAGTIGPLEYKFPAPDNSVDVVFAISIFTHFDPEVSEHYLREANRVLKPGGKLLTTWLVLDEVAAESKWAWDPRFSNRQPVLKLGDGAWASDDKLMAAYYAPESINGLHAKAGFAEPTIHLGSWSGRGDAAVEYQDVVVATASP